MALWMLPAATAALGAISGHNKSKQIERQNMAEAEKTRYSPWTGMQGQIQSTGGGALDGAIQGGVRGLGMAQAFGGFGGAAGGAAEAAGPSAIQTAAQNNKPFFESGNFEQMDGIKSAGFDPSRFAGRS